MPSATLFQTFAESPNEQVLQNDMGCGKTVVATAACWFAKKRYAVGTSYKLKFFASQHF